MKSSRLMLSGAALLLACSDRPRVGPTGTETPPPTVRSWAVVGIVRDQNGQGGQDEAWLVGVVKPGRTYEIRVNSYYTAQVFDLRADFQ
jgi:hypothetical protein